MTCLCRQIQINRNMTNIIEVKNLKKAYHDGLEATVALDGVSFDIRKGEFVAIMGPSGSGKSTLLHLLGLLDTPTSGSYHFEGKNIVTFSGNELADLRNKKLGFVFQFCNQFSNGDNFLNSVYIAAHKNQPIIHLTLHRIDQCL